MLVVCSSCDRHRLDRGACPHCGATMPSSSVPTRAALLLGLATAGACTPVTTDDTVQPLYGVQITETGDTGDSGDES